MFDYDPLLGNCRICDSTNIVRWHQDYQGRIIYLRKNCFVQFMNPQYSDEYLNKFYSDYIHFNIQPEYLKCEKIAQDFYLSLAEKYTEIGTLLDVGCGIGNHLEAAQKRGWKSIGFDLDPTVTEQVSKNLGVPVYSGDFLKLALENESLNAVTMHHVIEHLKSPAEYLKKIHTLLKSRGVLLLILPNIWSLSNLFKFFLEKSGLRKKHRARYYDADHHLFYFYPASLRKALSLHGFKVVLMRNGYHLYPHHSELRKFWLKNVSEVLPWKSTFFAIAQKV